MEKRKQTITPYMRERLLENRNGKLTSEQWKDMVMEPLVTLLLLLAPAILILGPRLVVFGIRGWWLVMLATIIAVSLTTLFRARRYARARVHFRELEAGQSPRPFWMFWKPQVLYDDNGAPMSFHKRLAPYMALQPYERYLVYYIEDADERVLLSMAPADHPDADQWQPSETFQRRYQQRA